MACCQEILAIPAKKHDRPAVAHLTVSQTRQLLTLPDRSTRTGRRDATLLATLYDTAARVQELADLTVARPPRGRATVRRCSPATSGRSSPTTANLLPSFAMWPALPASDYYEGSVPLQA
jgi:integrase